MATNRREYMREYSRRRHQQRKQEAIEFLGSKCVRCGSTNDLHFDHIDPETKLFAITTALASRSKQALEVELRKCQLLCKECHKAKTRQDMGWKKTGTHGTLNGYTVAKCRCDACRAVWNEACRRYRKTYRDKLAGST